MSTMNREHGPGTLGTPALAAAARRFSRVADASFAAAAARRMSMFRRPSMSSSLHSHKTDGLSLPVKMENTYRMHPDSDYKFNASRVEKALHGILESFLDNEVYEARKCARLTQSLTDVIKARVKEMGFPRYKFVCNVVVGQNMNQGFRSSARSIWNTDTDNFATATYTNPSMFAVASVYATYFE